MGHRKHSAPRRGSLAYRPRGRAKRFVPRVRTWPRVGGSAPVLLGFPSFKAGTIHAITTDDREKTPNFGKPLFNPATVLAVPEAEVVGVRLYARENGGERAIAEWHSNIGNESEQEKTIGGWRERLARGNTVARAGQKGFQERTETGKRILLIGNAKERPITPPGGFLHFGNVEGDYAVVKGSLPGSPKRFVLLRHPARSKVKRKIAQPQITELSPVGAQR